jgi:hypothetical protein
VLRSRLAARSAFPDCPGGLRNTGKITFEDFPKEMKGEITAQRATDEQRSAAPDSNPPRVITSNNSAENSVKRTISLYVADTVIATLQKLTEEIDHQ